MSEDEKEALRGMTRDEQRELDKWRNRPLPPDAPCGPMDDVFAYIRWLEAQVMELRELVKGAGRH